MLPSRIAEIFEKDKEMRMIGLPQNIRFARQERTQRRDERLDKNRNNCHVTWDTDVSRKWGSFPEELKCGER